MDRAQIVHENFLSRVAAGDLPQGRPPTAGLSDATAVELFRAMCLSRALDLEAREMQRAGTGFYTIGSSGHEGMAAVAAAARPTDIAFLHYRDAAFQIARSQQVPGQDMALDMLLSFACSSEDPISGGRHKVLGSRPLMIPPQTSTIASHLPKSVGVAYSIGLARRNTPEHKLLPDDGIAICTFGDASANHSTAQGALNTAGWASVQSAPLPLLFVCEDNGIGISVKTPRGWIEAMMQSRPGLRYFKANGLDIYETSKTAKEAVDFVRQRNKPAILHISMVRLFGHAGADVPTAYLDRAEVEADEANDPLLHTVRLLDTAGALPRSDALEIYTATRDQVSRLARSVADRPRLTTATSVMGSLIPPKRDCAPTNGPDPAARNALFGSDLRQQADPQPMGRLINWALHDLMLAYPEIIAMGEDVGRKGGVYGVTQRLHSRFGPSRVIDTVLDEQSILGLAIGMAQNGFIPIPEIQFLAYLHNAEDQLRGEAATLPFFSNGQFTNPMVVRIAGLGYQKGFGGHFHNDNSLAVLRDIPGLIIACPSRGDDAARMLRECVRLAREEQRVVVFIEPIALYAQRDLCESGDGAWMTRYPAPQERIALGQIGCDGDGTDLAIVTYGNGRHLSVQAAKALSKKGVSTRVIDLRWLAPLAVDAIVTAARPCRHVLIVDECRETGGQAEALMAQFAEAGLPSFARVTGRDSFIATGPAYAATLPSVTSIVEAADRLVAGR